MRGLLSESNIGYGKTTEVHSSEEVVLVVDNYIFHLIDFILPVLRLGLSLLNYKK